MVQPVDMNSMKPVYNAVNINIRKPEVNKSNNSEQFNIDDGIYNAVNIGIDNPTVNTKQKNIYEYPEAKEPVTYQYANIIPADNPRSYNFAYQTTNLILPKIENEVDIEDESLNKEDLNNTPTIENVEEDVEVPEPNYTTTEAENTGIDEDNARLTNKLNFKGKDNVEIKKPEIIPSEEIKPDVDIQLTLNNLNNKDYDIQASQMEEIARLSLDKPENVIPYIVRDVFTSLIDISKKNTKNLTPPNEKQIEARKKIITNYLVLENAKRNNTQAMPPFQITEEEMDLANELSPMEQAERNKEYALYTMSILAKVYTDEIEKETGNIVPLTDLPGSAAIVDALRYNPNGGVKIAAIESLMHLQRPEYKDELNVLYTLAAKDSNPQVAMIAQKAIANIDKN